MCIVAERLKGGNLQYLIRWDGYDHTYDTWEYRGDILDKNLVAKWCAKVSDVHFELWSMRSAVGQKVRKMRAEAGDVDVPIPAVHGAGAHALLGYLARPPSREGKSPLIISEKTRGGRVHSSLSFNALEDIGWVLLLQTIYPGDAYGALIYCKGRSHDRDMLFVGPQLTVECAPRGPLHRVRSI